MLREGYLDKIYYRYWWSDGAIANVFAIHGLGGHCLWFDSAGELFVNNQINFFSFDLPAFGQSKYPLGEISSYKVWVEATREVLKNFLVNFFVSSPVFILGHSMGALIAVLLTKTVKASGWVLSVPGFDGAKESFPTTGFVLPVFFKSIYRPKELVIVPYGPELLTRNKETQIKLKQDPFRVINLSADIYKHVYFLSLKAKSYAKGLSEPVLMLIAGKDMVCSGKSMENFFSKLKVSDKSKKIYTNSFHDLFVEDEINCVVNDISQWVKERV